MLRSPPLRTSVVLIFINLNYTVRVECEYFRPCQQENNRRAGRNYAKWSRVKESELLFFCCLFYILAIQRVMSKVGQESKA